MATISTPNLIFVVGAPRSGTSVLLDFLTVPKQVAWIPQKLAENPKKLRLAGSTGRQNWPLLGEFFLERRFAWKSVPKPATGPEFWEHYLPGFTPPDSAPYVPGKGEVTDKEKETLREVLCDLCDRQRKGLLVAEYTGFPRIRLMREIFPEARFIQVIRDPRSVAYHMVKKMDGANHQLWQYRAKWKDLMPPALRQRLEELPDTPLNFSGGLVRWYHELYAGETGELPAEDFCEVAYSDLLAKPTPTLKKVMKFADLEMNNRFKYYLKFHDIQQSNQRTNRNLSGKEADELALAVSQL
ncbi:MAG: sulfotransferase [Kiritimatiellia bacterium]